MAEGIKVAELFAALGVKTDQRSFKKAEKELEGLRARTEKAEQRASRTRESNERREWSTRMDRMRHGLRMQQQHGRIQELQERINAKRATRGVRGMMGRDVGSVRGVMGGLALGIGAPVAAVALAGRDAMKFDEQLTRLDINSKGAMGSLGGVRDRILAVSKATGVAKEEILGGASAFVALTGDGNAANKSLETFARIKVATGASTEDIAGTAAAMSQQLGIVPDQLEKAFSIVHAGAKAGSVEFSDMASHMASLAASFKGTGKSQGLGGLANLNAMYQIAAQDFGGDASQASTGMERLVQALSMPRTIKAAKALGVDLFDKMADGSVRVKPLMQVLEALKAAGAGKDPRILSKLFESSEAQRATRAILNNLDAVKELSAETMKANDIQEDYVKAQQSASARTAKLWNEVKVSVAEAFTPERLQAFASMLSDIVDGASRLPGFFQYILTLGGKDNQDDANREVDRRVQGGETLEQIAADDVHDNQYGNVRREAQRRVMDRNAGSTVSDAQKVISQFEAYKAGRGADFGEQSSLAGITAVAVQRQAITRSASPAAPVITNNLTVNTTGGDPHEIARVVTDKLQFWTRDVAASLGQ